MLKKLPKRPATRGIENEAVMAVKSIIDEAGHDLELTNIDYGVEGRIIYTENGRVRGFLTHLQIKGTRNSDPGDLIAFMFRMKVATINFLCDRLEPAYVLVYNGNSKKTYFREIHDIAAELNCSKPNWQDLDHVSIMILTSAVFSHYSIANFLQEAKAWTEEENSTKEHIEFLESEVKRLCGVTVEKIQQADGEYWRIALSGVFRSVRLFDYLSTIDFASHLTYCHFLCIIYRIRLARGTPPALSTIVAAFGQMNLHQLTLMISTARQEYERLLGSCENLPEIRTNEDALPEAPHSDGIKMPSESVLSIASLREQVKDYFGNIGCSTLVDENDDSVVYVSFESVLGFISLRNYRRTITKENIVETWNMARSRGADASIVIIHSSQALQVGKARLPRVVDSESMLIGSAALALPELESRMLECAMRKSMNRDGTIKAALIRAGYSISMPEWTDVDQDETLEFQRLVVRRYLKEALETLKSGRFISFAFLFADKHMAEVYTILDHTQLLCFIAAGPGAFMRIGGNRTRMSRKRE